MQHSQVKLLTFGLEKKFILVTTLFALAMPLFAQEKATFFGIGGTIVNKPNHGPNGMPATPNMPPVTMPNTPAPAPVVDYNGDYDRYGHGGRYGRHGHGGGRLTFVEYLQTFINGTFVGEKIIPVKQLLNLGYGKYGKAIYQVKIEAKSMFGFGTAQLLINGQAVSMPERLSTMLTEKTFEIPRYTNRNDIEIRTLQILLKGQNYVSKLGVVIQK